MSNLTSNKSWFSNNKLIVVIIILLAMFFIWWSVKDHELVEREIYTGFSSDVTQSRYAILQEFLTKMDLKVERHVRITSVKDLKDSQGVLFIGILPDRYSDVERSSILSWVEAGGHLVINANDTTYYYDDESEAPQLLHEFKIMRKHIPYGDRIEDVEFNVGVNGSEYLIASQYESTFLQLYEETQLVNSNDNADRFIQIRYKNGLVSVFNSTSFMGNNQLIENDHAAFAHSLFRSRNGDNKVWIVEQPRMPHFTELIWDYYRSVVISCLVLLAVYIFRKGRRFGSIIQVEETSRRSLLEQIHAAGLFAVKTKTLGNLVERVRTDLKRKIERKHATISFDSDGDIYKDLAQITQIDQKEIEFAFQYTFASIKRIGANQQIEFFNIIKALHKIGKSI